MNKEYCDYIWDIITGDTDRHAHYVSVMNTWPDSVKKIIINTPVIPGERMNEIVSIRVWEDRFNIPKNLEKPMKILVSYHGELMNNRIADKFIEKVINVMRENNQHEFYVISKNCRRYAKFKWPSNVFLGARINDQIDSSRNMQYLRQMVDTNNLWVLCDPLTEIVNLEWYHINWAVFDSPIEDPKKLYVIRAAQDASRYDVPIYITDIFNYDRAEKSEPKRRV